MKQQKTNNWKTKKLGEVVDVFDNLRKPINSTERLKRINGKKTKDLFPYYGATGQVGWIDSYLTEGEFILVGEDGAPFLDNYKSKAYKIINDTRKRRLISKLNKHCSFRQGLLIDREIHMLFKPINRSRSNY